MYDRTANPANYLPARRLRPVSRLAVFLMLLTMCAVAGASDDLPFDPDASAEEILDALLEAPIPEAESSPWQTEAELRVGCGYAKNVLFSPFAEESSIFSGSEAEFFALRQGDSQHRLTLYAFGSHRHHFDLDHNNAEYLAVAQGAWEHRNEDKGAYGLRGTYYFVDQFFDASVSDIETDATRLRQHDAGANTFIRCHVRPYLTAEVGSAYRYSALDDSDDDYAQWEASASLEGKTTSGLTLGLGYRYRLDDYDEREKRTERGEILPEETVNVANYEMRLYGYWFWDSTHRWKTKWHVTSRTRDDNGGGYYDYQSWRGTIGTSAKFGRWEADVNAGYTHTEYDTRPSDILNPLSSPLERERWNLWVRVERGLTESWRLFAELNWEDNDANDPLDVYDHLSGVAGLGYAFATGN